MSSPPRKLLLLFFLILWILDFLPDALGDNMSYDFPSFNLRNLTLLGDSYLRNGAVGLTRELGVPSSSSGSVIFNIPITFLDPKTNASASFSTNFTFKITNRNPNSFGDGLTFFISPKSQVLGSSGAYLGLVNASNPTKNQFIAVEFDTRLDALFGDPNSNHVGLDIDNLNSTYVVDASAQGIDLKSGNLIRAWIEYVNDQKRVNIWSSYSSFRPEKPLLSVKKDLSKHFNEFMYVGFSASTDGSTEVHVVESWSFQTFGFHSSNLTSHPHNVSDTSWSFIPVIPVFPDSASGHKSNKKLALGLGITGPVVFVVIFVAFGWYSTKKWKENRKGKSFTPEMLKGPRKFDYRELREATKCFHSSRVVGHGAFGAVYKAVFPGSGNVLAVKRWKHTHQGKSEFLSELTIIACLRHKNLLQLQGWCDEKGELLLVYDFMENGSVDNVLFKGELGITLSWAKRYNIAVGVASALMYLHQECEQQVVHRDIKTSNIMLDGNFNPRLGDFGLARLMDHDKSPVSTLTAGTMGYLAPEYLQYGKATEKTDVFSYGIVILEVACGRRPIEKDAQIEKMVNLVDWVWGLYSEDKLIEAADPRLNGEFDKEEMRRLLLLGMSCANPDSTERPSMRRVLQILNNEAPPQVLPRSKPCPTFSCNTLNIHDIVPDSEDSAISSPLYELKVH